MSKGASSSLHLIRTTIPNKIGNVNRQADLDFMAELKRTDRPRFDRLILAMQKQAFKDLKTLQTLKNGSVSC
jgi:hypothetical protein